MVEIFTKKAIGSEEEIKPNIGNLMEVLKKHMKEFKKENRNKWGRYY